MDVSTRAVHGMAEVPAGPWDALVAGSPVYLRYDWLRAAERCHDLEMVCFLAYHGDTLVGGAPAMVVRAPGGFPYHDPLAVLFGDYELEHLRQAALHPSLGRSAEEEAVLRTTLSAVVRAESEFVQQVAYPSLVVTSPYGYACDVPTLPGYDRAAVIERLLSAMDEHCLAERMGSSCLLWRSGHDRTLNSGLDSDLDGVLDLALADRGYARVLSDLAHELDVGAFSDFDDYLDALGSHRRRRVRGEMRAFDRSGLRVERIAWPRRPDAATISACARLHAAHQEKYGLPTEERSLERFFGEVLAGPGLGAVLHVLRRGDDATGDDIAGFLLSLESDGVVQPKFVGFDPLAVSGVYAYFNLVFYRLVGEAVAGGARIVDFGMGSADAKRLRGASPVPVSCWIRLAEPAARRRLAPYLAVFNCLKQQILHPQEET